MKITPLRNTLALFVLTLTALLHCTPAREAESFERIASNVSQCKTPAGHSHDDYKRPTPLETALNSGFHSVDIDVFRLYSELRACSTHVGCPASAAFTTLYLDPLSELSTHPELLRIEVDVKVTSALFKWQTIEGAYADVKAALGARPELQSWVEVTFFGANQNFPPPVGNPSYIKFRASSNYYLVSAGWPYSWNGTGTIPPTVESDIAARVSAAHSAGKQIMFSSFPIEASGNPEAVWDALHQADVDYVSTDDPPRYATWTASACPPPPEPDAGADASTPELDAGSDADAAAPDLDAGPDAH